MFSTQCPFCNHQNPTDAKFCNDCGSPLDLKPCSHCPAIAHRSATRCLECGSAFPSVADDAIATQPSAEAQEATFASADAPHFTLGADMASTDNDPQHVLSDVTSERGHRRFADALVDHATEPVRMAAATSDVARAQKGPESIGDEPGAMGHEPSVIGDERGATDDESSAIGDRSSATGDELSTMDEEAIAAGPGAMGDEATEAPIGVRETTSDHAAERDLVRSTDLVAYASGEPIIDGYHPRQSAWSFVAIGVFLAMGALFASYWYEHPDQMREWVASVRSLFSGTVAVSSSAPPPASSVPVNTAAVSTLDARPDDADGATVAAVERAPEASPSPTSPATAVPSPAMEALGLPARVNDTAGASDNATNDPASSPSTVPAKTHPLLSSEAPSAGAGQAAAVPPAPLAAPTLTHESPANEARVVANEAPVETDASRRPRQKVSRTVPSTGVVPAHEAWLRSFSDAPIPRAGRSIARDGMN